MEILVYLTVFLLLGIVSILAVGLGENVDQAMAIAKEIKGKKKDMLKQKSSLGKRLSKLSRMRKNLVVQVQMSEHTYRLMTIACIIAGGAVGKLVFKSMAFVLLIGGLGAAVPLLYLSFKGTKTRSSRMEKLRSTMMILSGSYIVTEDLLKTVQDNLELLEYPKPFQDFLTYCNYIDGNIKVALRRLEAQVNNAYFSQWIDVLVMAQDDRQLKYVTMSVVDSMNDVAQAQMESDTAIYAVWREYFMVLALIFAAPLIFKILMPMAYEILVTSLVGQGLFVLLLAAVVFSLVRALKLNKPILM
ncbi:MAG: hypothetical protein CVU91_12620 [Firmicutes bacterium HGW-Firmicutes-16]|nr:MAG: hypothetical protein CVU91_12620 [Firmicutes bacterium HGW-Firmicutes-16]